MSDEQLAADAASEGDFPALPEAVSQMRALYDEISNSMESVHARASVALALYAAAATQLPNVVVVPEQASCAVRALLVLAYAVGAALLCRGVYLLYEALLTSKVASTLDPKRVVEQYWHGSVNLLLQKVLRNLEGAIEDRTPVMHRKASLFNSGMRLALLGIAAFVTPWLLTILGDLLA